MNLPNTAAAPSLVDHRWPDRQWWDRLEIQFGLLATSTTLLLSGVVTSSATLICAGSVGYFLFGRVALGPRSIRLAGLAPRLLSHFAWRGEYESLVPEPPPEQDPPPQNSSPEEGPDEIPASIVSTHDLVDAMIATHRYALLLRPESADHLQQQERQQAIASLDEQMAVVPAGAVLVGLAAERATLGQEAEPQAVNADVEGVARIEACYLNRYPVTNAEFQQFVDAGGYEDFQLWPEEALPALFEFIDQTGEAGPRYWSDQQHAPGEQQLPVVGISWYEAMAYAHWVGKRLPTDAEWTKACAWPIEAGPGRISQRRYPWGESFENRRANLWVSGQRQLAPVDAYGEGVTIGAIEQMIGNVWEWTVSSLDNATPSSVKFPSSLRSIRGGAFNTYFENQATCHFQSGEHSLARRPNLGVRLALSMSSLAAR